MALPDRKAQPPDRKALAKAIEDLLLASGAELDAETRESPARVAKAFAEDLLDGYTRDPIDALKSSLVPAPSAPLQGDGRGGVRRGPLAGRIREDRRGDRRPVPPAHPSGAAGAPPL